MARRVGWSTYVRHASSYPQPAAPVSQMSDLLEREAALHPHHHHQRASRTLPVAHETSISMHVLSASHPTISTCGRFLLLIAQSVIYIYALSSSSSSATLLPVARIEAPRRVFAVSMDTSAGRFAVAALLDGRVGMVCELDDHTPEPATPSGSPAATRPPQRDQSHVSAHGHEQIRDSSTAVVPYTRLATVTGAVTTDRAGLFTGMRGEVNVIHIRSPTQNVHLFNASMDSRSEREWPRDTSRSVPVFGTADQDVDDYERPVSRARLEDVPTSSLLFSQSTIPPPPSPPQFDTEPATPIPSSTPHASPPIHPHTGPLHLYPHICSPTDPPTSVAICPSRRCVAFGCAAGVELHWVDARGARNLMKWFPLTAPSEVLAFLPWRVGVDRGNRLRLVSSVDLPATSVRGRTSYSGAAGGVLREREAGASASGMRGWEGVMGAHGRVWRALRRWAWDADPDIGVAEFEGGAGAGGGAGTGDEFDHYRALPLSDGTHLLFVDPRSGDLMLGSDAPLAAGTARLLRKVRFVPPDHLFQEERDGRGEMRTELSAGEATGTARRRRHMPAAYAASRSLRQGVRVVASYGDIVVLYTVPPDVFADLERLGGTAVQNQNHRGGDYGAAGMEGLFVRPGPERALLGVIEDAGAGGEEEHRREDGEDDARDNGGWGEWAAWWGYKTPEVDDGRPEGETGVTDFLPLVVRGVVVGESRSVEALAVESVGGEQNGTTVGPELITHENDDGSEGLVVWAFGEGGKEAITWNMGSLRRERPRAAKVTRRVVMSDGSVVELAGYDVV